MPLTLSKIAKMRELAAKAGAESVYSPARRPPDSARLQAMRTRSQETVEQELRRIVNVPIRYTPTPDDIDLLSQHYFQAHAYNDGWRLLPTQADSLLAYSETQGGFLPLAVGGGKTLTSLLIANDAYTSGKDKIMLIVPPSLATQLCDTDIKHWRPLTIFNVPVHRLQGLDKHKRLALAQSGRKGIYVFTYSLLSSADAHEILQAISPDLIILDEAHCVSKKSARTRRFHAYLHEKHPQIVALSGTMTQKSLMDYFELARSSLGKNNFLPNSPSLTEEWSKLIDTSASSISEFRNDVIPQAGPLKYVLNWARTNFPAESFEDSVVGFRRAFQKRFMTTPGVVCSSGDDLPYSLYITNSPVEKPEGYAGFDIVQKLLKQLDEKWLTPNGDEIEEAMLLYRWKYWLSGAGFYTELYWPEVDWLKAHGTPNDTQDILDRSIAYHDAHMDYSRELRAWIKNRASAGLDTPMLIGKNMSLYGSDNVGAKLYDAWKRWHDADFDGRIERNRRAVRVCGFKVEKAVEWVRNLDKGEGGIVWYDNDEMGEWVSERLTECGLEHIHCKAGEAFNRILTDRVRCKGKVLVLTINAHGTGKNLQFDRNQFYLQWPRSAKIAEQSIGRQHRIKQEYDEVLVTTCNTTEFDHVQYAATLNDAAYVSQSTGNKQKVIYASYATAPKIIPFEALVEFGAQPIAPTLQSRMLLQRTFGA